MARPTNDPKTGRIDLRLPPRVVSDVDEWRRVQPDIPARSEAMRRLIEQGLCYDDLRKASENLLRYVISISRPEEWSKYDAEIYKEICESVISAMKNYVDRLDKRHSEIYSYMTHVENMIEKKLKEEKVSSSEKFLESGLERTTEYMKPAVKKRRSSVSRRLIYGISDRSKK